MVYVKTEPEDDKTQALAGDVCQLTNGSEDEYKLASAEEKGSSRKRPRLDSDGSDSAKDEIEDKPKKWFKNPKVKFKLDRAFNEKTLHHRLLGINHISINETIIPPEIRDFAVPRELISYHYGGNTQETFPSIGKNFIDQHGLVHWMYPNLDYNPACPQLPGHPGLFFIPTPEKGDKKAELKFSEVRRVVTRLATGQWLYMGDYFLIKVAPLTTTEWEEQYPEFKKTWTREICKKVYGRKVLKRMAARRRFNCRDPDEQQLFTVEESGEWNRFSPEDVENAFASGEETFEVWKMVCDTYDADFQRDLHERFKSWPPSDQGSKSERRKAKKQKSSRKRAAKTKVTRAGKKRKRVELSDSETSESELDVVDLYDDNE